MMEAHERYREDPKFAQLVDVMTSMVMQGEYTPSEMRLAAIMACTRVEMMDLRRVLILSPEEAQALKVDIARGPPRPGGQ